MGRASSSSCRSRICFSCLEKVSSRWSVRRRTSSGRSAGSRAIEGKTWNHPVLVRDVLLVRNGEEMAAFRLAVQR